MFSGGLLQMLGLEPGADAEAVPAMAEAGRMDEREVDPETMRLVMKKRQRLIALKKMLENAGYGDLAKMSSVRKEGLDDGY